MSSGLKKDWRDVYDDIYEIYWVQDRTLEETMQVMRTMHNFSATWVSHSCCLTLTPADEDSRKKQWVTKMGEWHLKKNISTNEMQNIVRIQQKRKAEDDKDTDFTIRGRHVSQDNIDRWQKRQKCDASEAGKTTEPYLGTSCPCD